MYGTDVLIACLIAAAWLSRHGTLLCSLPTSRMSISAYTSYMAQNYIQTQVRTHTSSSQSIVDTCKVPLALLKFQALFDDDHNSGSNAVHAPSTSTHGILYSHQHHLVPCAGELR